MRHMSGLSEGRPGQDALFEDALFIYDQITRQLEIEPDNIVLAGRSLGSGVAVYVASQRPVGKLILITPFDSIRNMARKMFPFLPTGLLLKHPFDSLEYSKSVTSPMLMILAGRDELIPAENSYNLERNWRGEHRVKVIESADHNSIGRYPEFWRAMYAYLND